MDDFENRLNYVNISKGIRKAEKLCPRGRDLYRQNDKTNKIFVFFSLHASFRVLFGLGELQAI